MAARVSADDVKEIMETSTVNIDDKIEAMIISADLIITQVFQGDTSTGTALIKEIERWFVAHMVSVTLRRTVSEEGIGDVRIKYAGVFTEGLKSTPYGQMVLTLDTSGRMARSGKAVAGIFAVPTTTETFE